jgi:hypothetical protein
MSTNSDCISLVKRVIQCLREDSDVHGKYCQNQDSSEHREYLDNNTLFANIGKRLGVGAPMNTMEHWQEVHRLCELLAEFMRNPEYFSALDLSDDEKMDIRWELRERYEPGDGDFVERKTLWTHESLKHELFKLIENTSIHFCDFVAELPQDEWNQTLSGFSTLFDLDLDSDDDDDDEPWRDPELEFFHG